jgi:hypothetical protein
MDYSDHSIGLSTTSVDGLPQAFPSVESTLPVTSLFGVKTEHDPSEVVEDVALHGTEPDALITRSFLRLVPTLQVPALPSVVTVPPTAVDLNAQMSFQDLSRVPTSEERSRVRTADEGGVMNLFGEVSDEEFPEVSANHPARSMQAHPTVSKSVTVSSASTAKSPRTLRTLAALSSHPFTPQTDELGLPIVAAKQPDALPKQQAPGRSRSYERRRPGSVGGVRAAVARSSHPALASPDTLAVPNTTNSLNPTSPTSPAQSTRALQDPSADILPRVRSFVGPDIDDLSRTSVDGVRISTRTVRNAGIIETQTILDLRGAETQQPVRRRSPNTQTPNMQMPNLQVPNSPATQGVSNTSYFAGHGYELDRRQASRQDRSVNGRSTGLAESVPRQRLSLRTRIFDRTGLSPAVVGGLGLATVGVISVGLLFSPLFALHHIDVRRAGSARARIRTAADLQSGAPLISLNVSAIQRRIVALPEVSAAKVERKWPRGLRITVATRTPVVALAHAGRIALVATDGTVLRDFSAADGTNSTNGMTNDGVSYTPITSGAIAPTGKLVTGDSKRIVALVTALDPDLRDRLVAVSLTGDDLNASFSSAGRATNLSVHFGDEYELAIKAQALGALLGAESSGNVTGIDLTVPDAPVLRLGSTKGNK